MKKAIFSVDYGDLCLGKSRHHFPDVWDSIVNAPNSFVQAQLVEASSDFPRFAYSHHITDPLGGFLDFGDLLCPFPLSLFSP